MKNRLTSVELCAGAGGQALGLEKHGGPDLGPTRARRAWATLGVNGSTVTEAPPELGHEGMPRLSVRMVALLQGFPDEWQFIRAGGGRIRMTGEAEGAAVARIQNGACGARVES